MQTPLLSFALSLALVQCTAAQGAAALSALEKVEALGPEGLALIDCLTVTSESGVTAGLPALTILANDDACLQSAAGDAGTVVSNPPGAPLSRVYLARAQKKLGK